MKPIPCVKEKCILFPVCISKREIECDDLTAWLGDRVEDIDVWKHMRQYLKKVHQIAGQNKVEISI